MSELMLHCSNLRNAERMVREKGADTRVMTKVISALQEKLDDVNQELSSSLLPSGDCSQKRKRSSDDGAASEGGSSTEDSLEREVWVGKRKVPAGKQRDGTPTRASGQDRGEGPSKSKRVRKGQ